MVLNKKEKEILWRVGAFNQSNSQIFSNLWHNLHPNYYSRIFKRHPFSCVKLQCDDFSYSDVFPPLDLTPTLDAFYRPFGFFSPTENCRYPVVPAGEQSGMASSNFIAMRQIVLACAWSSIKNGPYGLRRMHLPWLVHAGAYLSACIVKHL